jgi:hypothetical protein
MPTVASGGLPPMLQMPPQAPPNTPPAWQSPNQPQQQATRFAPAPPQTPPRSPLRAQATETSSTGKPTWLYPALAVVAAIIVGILIAQIFFV